MNTSINVPFAFPLAIQTVLPDEYRGRDFRNRLSLLQKLGFSGVELNIVRPEAVDPADLKALLAEYGLRLTMFASGATAPSGEVRPATRAGRALLRRTLSDRTASL